MKQKHSPSTQKDWSPTNDSPAGFSLIEVILSGALLILLLSAFSGTLITGHEQSVVAGSRARALFFADEGLEASRSIRDANGFSALANGTYGLAQVNNRWSYVGSSDMQDFYTRSIAVSTVDADTKKITSTVTWQQTPQRTGSVAAISYLSNWKTASSPPPTQAQNTTINIGGAFFNGSTKQVEGMTITNAGSAAITIAKITAIWQNDAEVTRIKINSNNVWSKTGPGSPSGSQESGTTLTIQSTAIPAQTTATFEQKFDERVRGAFTITLTFSDNSTKSVTFNL